MKILFSLVLLTFALQTSASMFKYNELMIKDYDEVLKMVQGKVKQARAAQDDEDEATSHLREALKLILSRPNSDNMIAKLLPDLRRELMNYNAYEKSVHHITQEAIDVLKNKKAATSQQVTGLFVLENTLGEIRPEAATNEELRAVIQMVRDAKLRPDKEATNEMRLRGMFSAKNPSDVAKDILKTLPKIEKKSPVAPPPEDD